VCSFVAKSASFVALLAKILRSVGRSGEWYYTTPPLVLHAAATDGSTYPDAVKRELKDTIIGTTSNSQFNNLVRWSGTAWRSRVHKCLDKHVRQRSTMRD
jgi:hypothetical protein